MRIRDNLGMVDVFETLTLSSWSWLAASKDSTEDWRVSHDCKCVWSKPGPDHESCSPEGWSIQP
jgi:hypothetical protein